MTIAQPEVAMSAAEIIDLSKRHTIFSWSAQGAINPIPMVRGEGIYFWDADGKRYVDMNSQLMCVNIGHGNRRVIDAIKRQADELAYAGPGMASPVRARVGKMLADLTPGDLNRFFFTLGGAEANENAIRIARMVSGRQKIMARYRSYHGATLGAISLTGEPRRWANEPGLPGVVRFFDPYKYRSHSFREGDSDEMFTRRCLDEIEEIIAYEGGQTIAAIFIETVTGTNGIIVPPDGYIQGLRQICDRHGIFLVCDEVMCGLGRTGRWFAADHWNVVPDMITMAKGLTSGYSPLGGVICSDRIAEPFLEPGSSFLHGITFGGHPVSCAVALANLDIFEREHLLEHVTEHAPGFRERIDGLTDLPIVGEVRGMGYFLGIELVRDPDTKDSFTDAESEELLRGFLSPRLYDAGLICRADDRGDPVLQLSPPLIADEAEFDTIEAILRSVLTEAWKKFCTPVAEKNTSSPDTRSPVARMRS